MLKQIVAIITTACIAASCSTGKKTSDTGGTVQTPAENQNGVRVQKVNTTVPASTGNAQKTEILYDK